MEEYWTILNFVLDGVCVGGCMQDKVIKDHLSYNVKIVFTRNQYIKKIGDRMGWGEKSWLSRKIQGILLDFWDVSAYCVIDWNVPFSDIYWFLLLAVT